MRYSRIPIAFMVSFLSLLTVASAQNQVDPPEQLNAQQQQEMQQELQQLQQVQAKQRQQLNLVNTPTATQQNQPTAPTQMASTPQQQPQAYTADNGQKNQDVNNESYVPSSSFEYPFANQQIHNTPEMRNLNQQAFAGAVRQAMPLNPGQIHRLKQIYDSSQYAAAAPAGVPPQPTATSIFVNLSPGSTPPVIRLSEGFVSSLVFLDSTGSPWPIAAYDLGNPEAFNIVWDKKNNVLMIQAKTIYTYGNLAIQLRGLNTPVMLTLIPGQSIVDYRVDITIPGYGPDARQLPMETNLPAQATPILLNVLDGVPPEGAQTLTIETDIGQAWEVTGKMYLRTKYTLLSPGWLATMASADGTKAYELQGTSMLLMSKNGKVIHVKVGGF